MRGAIVDGFLQRLEEVVDRCLEAIWETVASYGRSGEPLREDVREAVRGNVAALAQVLSEGRELRREELARIEEVGARRAEAGIPLDDVLHAYRTVSRVCWDVLAEECRRSEADALEAAIGLAEAVLRYGATEWIFMRSLDDPLDFTQLAVFPGGKIDFERYWYAEDTSDARAAASGLYQVPVLPVFFRVAGAGQLIQEPAGTGS